MKPVEFKGQNATMMEEIDAKEGRLPICKTAQGWITCWKMDFWDRVRAVFFGRIWLYTYSKKYQHPVSMACVRDLFKKIPSVTPAPKNGYRIPQKRRKHGR